MRRVRGEPEPRSRKGREGVGQHPNDREPNRYAQMNTETQCIHRNVTTCEPASAEALRPKAHTPTLKLLTAPALPGSTQTQHHTPAQTGSSSSSPYGGILPVAVRLLKHCYTTPAQSGSPPSSPYGGILPGAVRLLRHCYTTPATPVVITYAPSAFMLIYIYICHYPSTSLSVVRLSGVLFS